MADPIRILLLTCEPEVSSSTRKVFTESAARDFEVCGEFETADFPPFDEANVPAIVVICAAEPFPEVLAQVLKVLPEAPVVAIQKAEDEALSQSLFKAGAADCLPVEQLSAHMLVRAMRYAIGRGKAERELKLERDLLHALLENIPDAIYFKDRKSCFLRISSAMAKMFGRPAEEIVGKSDFDFFLPDHAQAAFNDERRILKTGEPIVGKIECETHPNGRVTWANTTKMPLRTMNGPIIGTFGISRDITKLKQMENALALERNLLRSVIDRVPDSIFAKDHSGRYILTNKAHIASVGAQEESEVLGKTAADFFGAADATSFGEADRRVIEGGEFLVNYEEEISAPNGQHKWLLTTKVPLEVLSSGKRGLVCIGRDITEQKEAETRLVEANANLYSAMADLKNANEELRGLQLQVIEAEKMKSIGRLAAGVAHEVKNPLATISMGVDYLTGLEFQDAAVPEVIREIGDAVKRADGVIMGLLDFSAPRRLELKPCDLNAIIRRALTLVRGEFDAARMKVEEDLGELPEANLDRSKVSQVFVNVLTNAIHAMEGEGTLRVRTVHEQVTGVGSNVGTDKAGAFRAGDKVIVAEVIDSGPGFPPDRVTSVFEPFYTTKPTGKGTGLGMTVVKSIIDLHGGTVDIRNGESGGAIVRITFRCD